jgi:riboflavin kinase/FMN adenylyltransferase
LVVDPYGAAPDRLPAAISVGANRTFDGVEHRVEAHVLDRTDLYLYGKYVAVDFLQRLRAMIAFDSAAELLAAMAADIDAARNLTSAAGAAPAG